MRLYLILFITLICIRAESFAEEDIEDINKPKEAKIVDIPEEINMELYNEKEPKNLEQFKNTLTSEKELNNKKLLINKDLQGNLAKTITYSTTDYSKYYSAEKVFPSFHEKVQQKFHQDMLKTQNNINRNFNKGDLLNNNNLFYPVSYSF